MLDSPPLAAARAVAERLAAGGHRAVIAGGAVRDFLLGVPPRDADVATSAHPDEVAALFPDTKHVGASFGVVLVPYEDRTVEVATFRREGAYLDGRHPSSVTFTGEVEDAQRRDFTVNGLFLDPATNDVLDHVGGRADLDARILRAIGDPEARFREDHLRLLRAVRIGAQLGFTIDPGTFGAVRRLAPLASQVAAERTRDELIRLLTGPDPARGLQLLHEARLLEVVLPEVAAMDGVEQSPQHHPEGDVLTHTMLLFRHLESPTAGTPVSPELAFGALLHDVGKPPTFERAPDRIRFPMHAKIGADMADKIARRLRLSNDSTERVVALVEHHMRFKEVRNMRVATLKRFLGLPGFDEHLALHRADCLASHRNLENWEFCRAKLEEYGQEEIRPPRLLTGDDLIEMGYREGPDVGRELKRLEDLQLEGTIATRDEAVAQAQRDLSTTS
jgi:poly(A) polymerase